MLSTLIENFLYDAIGGKSKPLSPEVIKEFKESCGNALEKQFNQQMDWRIRMSGLGKPLCQQQLDKKGIKDFVIFHPCAQYNYKIYPQHLRHKLLTQLSELDIGVMITGSNNQIDSAIKKQLPVLPNVFDLIGETNLEEYFALSKLSLAYIGMDTLNMHIAAVQNKRIFAIFGPTNLKMWSPWSNELKTSASTDAPMQTYGNITLFQANMACVACGNAGCDNKHGKSDCLDHISSEVVFEEVKNWYQNRNA